MYHYTYLLIGLDHRLYIGVRSCNCLPEKDNYWGSFKDKTFKPISKHIQEMWSTRELAVAHEIELHNEFDVAKNPMFANRAKQTSIGWDTAGCNLTIEHKLKLSENTRRTKLGVPLGKSHREKIRQAHFGKRFKHKPETRAKIGLANRGTIHSKQSRQNMSYSHSFCYEIDGIVYLTTDKAAEALTCSNPTVRKRAQSDDYPNWKLLGKTNEYLRSQTSTAEIDFS